MRVCGQESPEGAGREEVGADASPPPSSRRFTQEGAMETTAKPTTKKRAAFGGYAIDFSGRRESMERIFGPEPIAPSEMTKRLWAFVRKHNLGSTK
jgi:hypothetical protein